MSHTIRVTCAIIFKDQKVLCAQRSEKMSLPLKWEFPGGKIEDGESPEQSLIREIKEELNLEIEILREFQSYTHDYNNGKVIELIPFLARHIGGDLELKEHKQVIWKEIGNLKKLDWAEADIPILEDLLAWCRA
ncbi:(deoxy)nucleoside triphosphate pyrophosphohydrolase [Cecembia rubra]|uniref:8-oxo-dGTP diphosphatase n=1 Tax=Cecembia rubra TaxID=1485585 RepID=A0A2P8EA89_9BACT|nr:(deoxy)nucleoside triphosphate pyrophosphohydrolase [Cecembia rubra]PSL06392.1 8-oxo-dGTP diphosphatase [Cecembia rubra]